MFRALSHRTRSVSSKPSSREVDTECVPHPGIYSTVVVLNRFIYLDNFEMLTEILNASFTASVLVST